MRYQLRHHAFDPDRDTGRDREVDEDRLADAIDEVLSAFGHGPSEDDEEFLVLTQADDRARRIGRWLVTTVQAAGYAGRFVLEFIVEDRAGDPDSCRSLRLAAPAAVHPDPAQREFFGRSAVACLLHCFVQQRDLSDRFDLVETWSAAAPG